MYKAYNNVIGVINLLHKLYIFFILFFVSSSAVEGGAVHLCLDARLHLLESIEPLAMPRIDRKKLADWINLQPKKLRPFFSFVGGNLEEITFVEFKEKLFNSFQLWWDRRDHGRRALTILPNNPSFSSEYWVVALLRKEFPEQFSKVNIFESFESFAAAAQTGPWELVFFDDAIYSGTQKSRDSLLTADEFVLSKTPLFQTVSYVFAYGIPEARQTIEKALAADEDTRNIKPTFFISGVLETFWDRFYKLDKKEQDRLRKIPDFSELTSNFRGISFLKTNTIFQHKVPDFVSFPKSLVDGAVFEYHLKWDRSKIILVNTVEDNQRPSSRMKLYAKDFPARSYPFIDQSQPPYRIIREDTSPESIKQD